MIHLYRVVPKKDWIKALACGLVARCPADSRRNRVHLNELKDVELVANLWFSVEEEPVALEVDVSSLAECLKWEARTEEPYGLWPSLCVVGIPIEHVVRVLRLDNDSCRGDAGGFRLGKALVEASAL